MPQMLRDIVREVLVGQPDMEIVGETRTDDELMGALTSEAIDVVVVRLAAGSQLGSRLQQDQGTANVVALSSDGRSGAMLELCARRTTVLEVSPEGLREAIRRAVAARGPEAAASSQVG